MARAKHPNAFDTFDVKLLLAGSRNNEIRLYGVTAPEVIVLKVLHGGDSVVEMKPAGPAVDTDENGKEVVRGDRAERQRLLDKYEARLAHRQGFIARVFGPNTIPLPRSVDADFTPDVVQAETPPPAAGEIDADAALMV